MKNLSEQEINILSTGMRRLNESSLSMKKLSGEVQPKTFKELVEIITETVKKKGWKCNLNFIDTSLITDMSELFGSGYGLNKFNGDISKWDVSNVTDMTAMFWRSKFNGDISKWNVSNVEDMEHMFCNSKFNGDISRWDVSNVNMMISMFRSSKFNGDISKWNVSSVKDMSYMFWGSKFNGDISKWNVSSVKHISDMEDMFINSPLEGREPIWYEE